MWKKKELYFPFHATLLFLLFVCIKGSSNPDIYGLVGSAAQLICPFRATNTQNIRWTKVGSVNTVYAENDIVNKETLSEEIYRRLSVTGNHNAGEYNLNISDIIQTDAGDYECGLGASTQTQIYTLHVIDAPTNVVIDNKNITSNRLLGTEGQNLRVKCTAVGGDPDPRVKLHIPGLSTTPSSIRSVEYIIQTINRSYDGQTVTCTASNNPNTPVQRSDSAEIYLNLKPLTPIFSKDQVSTEETLPLVVSCTSHGSRPAGSFLWLLGQKGINVTHNSTQFTPVHDTTTDTYTLTSTLTVNVDRTYNDQNIVCGVSNPATSTAVISTEPLNVKYAPSITVHNKTFQQTQEAREIQCVLDGNPDSYSFDKWQHKSIYGVLIRNITRNMTLTLPTVSEDQRYQDTGEYICTANNGIKDKSGKLKQTGSGYITSNAKPVFTSDNIDSQIQYGELGKSTEILVNVYSIPKYSAVRWYRDSTELKPSKYVTSVDSAVVKDMFHDVEVELDGYRVKLTISGLEVDDFDNYTLRVYTGNLFVQHTILLKSKGAPEVPKNFDLTESTQSTITVEWNPGYNGGEEQTFFIEYRISASDSWKNSDGPIHDDGSERMTYTLTGLQDGTSYEVRMYAENIYNKSSPTDLKIRGTIYKESQTSTAGIIGGVGGGLGVLIFILVVIAVIVIKRRSDTSKHGEKLRSNSHEADDSLKDNILYDSQSDSLKDNILYQTAGPNNETPGTLYADVKKTKKPIASSSDYAEVQKSNATYAEIDKTAKKKDTRANKNRDKKGRPKKTEKTKEKALNNNPDGEYSNAVELPMTISSDGKKRNLQGLEYADLTFVTDNTIKGRKPVIHGEEDRTIYSEVDHSKKAPSPPPEGEYEETNIKHNRKT